MSEVSKNWIVKNLLLAAALVVALLLCAWILMKIYTRHNQVQQVPDFSAMTISEALKVARSNDLRLDIVDSIYVKRMQRGAIVRQEPKAGAQVKKGRRIMVTINANTPKQVPMPNLVGYSLRSAQAELVSSGLEVGRLMYVSDIATNNVLRQLYKNMEIAPGTMLSSESGIDLVLGLSSRENTTAVPDVVGRTYKKAVEMIHESSLNVGAVAFDRNITTYQDSLRAVVYRQSPEARKVKKDKEEDEEGGAAAGGEKESIMMGRTVAIYLTLDENKVPKKD